MPNIKSQKKRSITNIKRNAAAKAQKSELKTLIKNVLKAVEASDKEAAVLAYNEVSSKLDKSITSNLHHKNYVSRQKARLSKAVNNVQ
ncbi:MAG: 30S ribosomal protein S20 [Erysipelotrichaceae bacterium]|nr:30S ribosomal protein S20 [Erysipelotrichaceae bacterium]